MRSNRKIIVIVSIIIFFILLFFVFKIYKTKTAWKNDLNTVMENKMAEEKPVDDFEYKTPEVLFNEFQKRWKIDDLYLFPFTRSRDVNVAYAKDDTNVYYILEGEDFVQILNRADPKTFTTLNNVYSKDQNNVYAYFLEEYEKDKTIGRDVHIIQGADPATFSLAVDNWSSIGKDKNNVYIYQKVVDKADPKSFRVIDSYLLDHNTVFKSFEPIADNVDTSNFRELKENSGVYTDNKNIYIETHVITDLDMSKVSLKQLKDKNGALYLLISDGTKDYDFVDADCGGVGCWVPKK